MEKQHVMITGERLSFLARVVLKKIEEAGFDCAFVECDINAINEGWGNTSLVILYMDEGEQPKETVLHFLSDKLAENDSMLIPIGENDDVDYVCGRVPKDLIYRAFKRPVNNDELTRAVTDLLHKVASGEFKKSILVVDDDPNFLGLVREWLKGTYRVSVANSGLQAIKWLGKNKVDLILLDHEMPVTTGPQVLEMLRSDEETKSIPVMFLTGKSDKESVMAVVALKPEGYFLKTISKEELLTNLANFFTQRKG